MHTPQYTCINWQFLQWGWKTLTIYLSIHNVHLLIHYVHMLFSIFRRGHEDERHLLSIYRFIMFLPICKHVADIISDTLSTIDSMTEFNKAFGRSGDLPLLLLVCLKVILVSCIDLWIWNGVEDGRKHRITRVCTREGHFRRTRRVIVWRKTRGMVRSTWRYYIRRIMWSVSCTGPKLSGVTHNLCAHKEWFTVYNRVVHNQLKMPIWLGSLYHNFRHAIQ